MAGNYGQSLLVMLLNQHPKYISYVALTNITMVFRHTLAFIMSSFENMSSKGYFGVFVLCTWNYTIRLFGYLDTSVN